MKKILFVSLSFLSLAGCQVLEKDPESVFSESNFYKSSGDAVSAVNAIYDPLNSPGLYNQIMWVYQDQATDESEWGGGRATANQAKNELDRYTFTPATAYFYQTWSTCYQAINRANTAIEKIPAIPMDEALKTRLVAEAKFMRGFYYLTLVRLFGKVPLVLQSTQSLNNLNVPRASVEEVYAQIVSDFSEAESVLPTSYTGTDKGRTTQGAAKAFLTKVYLTRGDWANAAAKAREVMALEAQGIYGLWDNYADVFALANENGKESIFEVQVLGGGFGEGSNMQGYMRPPFDRNGFGDNPVTQSHYNAYAPTDKRRSVNVIMYSASSTPAAPASVAYPVYVAKYKDAAATSNGEGSNNFPLLRYADVLLMYAEALNEQGVASAEAYNAVNRIRKRAGLENLTEGLGQAQFRDSVLHERRLELAFEGHRWYDLVRTGKLIEAMKTQNPGIIVEQKHYLFPVPQVERDANPLLDQNEGY